MKLESEVGSIRYIAEFVYGEEADRNLLEEAVRWVIATIIFVFDPLAVLLLIVAVHFLRYIDRGKIHNPGNQEFQDQHPSGGLKLSTIAQERGTQES